METESTATTEAETYAARLSAPRRRVRTEVWNLKREAARRRNKANALVVGSLVMMMALVRLLYALLTR
jgi:hypothetical protein